MAIRPFAHIPRDIREWSNFFNQTEVTPTDGTVGDNAFAARAGLSVIGRSASTNGTPADIIASGNNQFLLRRSNVLQFAAIQDSDLPSTIARDAEVASAAAAAQSAAEATAAAELAAHTAAADPHPGYRLESVNVPWAEVSGIPAGLSRIYTGTGTPEGAVTASVGSLFLRQDGGAGTTLYVKESGSGATGWVGK